MGLPAGEAKPDWVLRLVGFLMAGVPGSLFVWWLVENWVVALIGGIIFGLAGALYGRNSIGKIWDFILRSF
ncbi:MAG: hypothetical protein ACOCVG_01055 [Verrucomicrobiota bacterium]